MTDWNKYGKKYGISGDVYKMIFEHHTHLGEENYIKFSDVIKIVKYAQNKKS
jgi:hypothetical protein